MEKMTKLGLSNVSVKVEANLNIIAGMLLLAGTTIMLIGKPSLLMAIVSYIGRI